MKRPILLTTVLLILLSLLSYASTTTAAAASTFSSSSNGYAYAGYATVPVGSSPSTSNSIGPVAQIWLGCNPLATSVQGAVASMALGSYVKSGNVQTSITNSRTGTSATIQTAASIQNVNILSGLITASQIQAKVSSTMTLTNASSSFVNASFTGLHVAGSSLTTSPRPNTTIQLANLGYVVLNEQGHGPASGPNATYAGINLIDLHVTATNAQGLPVGTRLLIDQVNSSELRIAQPTAVSAHSYGFNVIGQGGSGSASSTPAAPADIDCTGGNAQNGLSATSSPQVGNTGQVNDTASGQIASSGTTANSQSTVQNANLLTGLIQGSQASAIANAAWNGKGSASASTSLINMTIAGIPLSRSPAPNTRFTIPGLGYVVLNEQTSSVSSSNAQIQVNAMDIYITQLNLYGLPVGMQIILGHATAGATSFA